MNKNELNEVDKKFREQAIIGFKSDVGDMICNCDFTYEELHKIMKQEIREINKHANIMLANVSKIYRFKQYLGNFLKA